MSSKTGTRAWSLTTRLILWYSAAASILTGATIATVYLTLTVHQDRETAAEMREMAEDLSYHRREVLAAPDEWICFPSRLIDESGRVRFESPQMVRLFPVETFPGPEGDGEVRTAADGRPYLLVAVRLEGWTYQLGQDITSERELMSRFRWNVALVALPTLVVSLAVGYVLARLGLRPVKSITAATRVISPARLGDRVPADGLPAELRELADTLNTVLTRMEEAFTRLDQFSADVAHELRTPVHNLRGGLEVALGQDRTPDDYRLALSGALNEADRLGRLVDRLLFLARAEDPRREVRRETIDVAGELNDLAEFFGPVAADAGVAIRVAVAAGLTFPLDRSLFQRAVSNLVGNALAHTPAGGEVCLAADSVPGGLRVAILDTGTGILPEDLPHLFDRFYRSRDVRKSGRGVGLGLAIVRRVVELHGGTVTIQSEPDQGTAVRMIFPCPAENDRDVISMPRA